MKASDTSIWFKRPSVEDINAKSTNSLVAHLGIRCIAISDDAMTFTMPVDERTLQPFGVLHGGASVALAETAGSFAATCCVDADRFRCYGIEINANHIRSVAAGTVTAVATPVHHGRSTHVWSVQITDDQGRLVCVSRITLVVVPTTQ